ncbi:MAG TPA: UDP-N-acetylglucosamine 2-epimerase (non-hydrolyzing) [Candidatus Binatia bacterium]|nr:UDP-N-acetylglucosamine 2-epimerase (non-hydrolyzing) [Candidatus Binatia bacterium]
MRRRKILSLIGTRPEAVKMAPVLLELARHREQIESLLVSTAQHREMLDQILFVFGVVPDVDLNIMRPNQTLFDITSRTLAGMKDLLERLSPDLLLVQGDTTAVFAASLAAFYLKISVGHIEAGLRSYDLANPYPEELNRRFTGMVATLHFAPTPRARQNLLDEGVAPERIFLTGNPVVDALQAALPKLRKESIDGIPGEVLRDGKIILVTAHRRENHGGPLESICLAVRELLGLHPEIRCIYPVHLNPQVRQTVYRLLGGVERAHLIPPLDYWSFIQLMARSFLVLTDSGGIQEEAPSLGKPVLVLRKVTERPEAAETGLAKVIGTDTRTVVAETSALLRDARLYNCMVQQGNPYGDGRAAVRIVDAILGYFAGEKSK